MRVLITDDQRVVRDGLATIVGAVEGMEVVGCAANGREAVQMAQQLRPDVVLMDLRMPEMGGAEATAAIRGAQPACQVVVLTTYADDESIVDALSAGAIGYLTKDAGRDDIRRAIEAAAAGQSILDPSVQALLLQAARQQAAGAQAAGTQAGAQAAGAQRAAGAQAAGTQAGAQAAGAQRADLPDGLTEREGEVLALIAEGLSNLEIAGRLYVAEATVKTHVNRIFAKTHSRDRAQAAAYAHRNGLAG